jgi:hypothetical protein
LCLLARIVVLLETSLAGLDDFIRRRLSFLAEDVADNDRIDIYSVDDWPGDTIVGNSKLSTCVSFLRDRRVLSQPPVSAEDQYTPAPQERGRGSQLHRQLASRRQTCVYLLASSYSWKRRWQVLMTSSGVLSFLAEDVADNDRIDIL